MRTNQLWKFVYKKGLHNIAQFSNLPSDLKTNLENNLSFKRVEISEKKYLVMEPLNG